MLPSISPFLHLPPRLRQQRAFSISAPLLQINDLICRNKQVSSTLSPVRIPLLLQTLQQGAVQRVKGMLTNRQCDMYCIITECVGRQEERRNGDILCYKDALRGS